MRLILVLVAASMVIALALPVAGVSAEPSARRGITSSMRRLEASLVRIEDRIESLLLQEVDRSSVEVDRSSVDVDQSSEEPSDQAGADSADDGWDAIAPGDGILRRFGGAIGLTQANDNLELQSTNVASRGGLKALQKKALALETEYSKLSDAKDVYAQKAKLVSERRYTKWNGDHDDGYVRLVKEANDVHKRWMAALQAQEAFASSHRAK